MQDLIEAFCTDASDPPSTSLGRGNPDTDRDTQLPNDMPRDSEPKTVSSRGTIGQKYAGRKRVAVPGSPTIVPPSSTVESNGNNERCAGMLHPLGTTTYPTGSKGEKPDAKSTGDVGSSMEARSAESSFTKGSSEYEHPTRE